MKILKKILVDALTCLVNQGVVRSLSVYLNAAQSLQPSPAGNPVKILEDSARKVSVVEIYLDQRVYLKAQQVMQYNKVAMRMGSGV